MADKPAKTNKPKARLPRGLADRGPAEIAATRRMLETIRGVYQRYGFEPGETPSIEYTDALGKFLPDQDRPNEGVFSFQDDDEQWLSLRYDLTAPLARYVAENFDSLPKPYRSYREGWVFRNEKPGPGRFRQFMQFDADTVGSASPAADAEICMMAADTMEALGIPRGSYVVKVNSRKVLEGLREAIGDAGLLSETRWLTVLRAMDKYDRLGDAGVRQLLGTGRRDESGDFTKGAELGAAAIETIMSIFEPVTDVKEKIAQLDIRLRDSDVGRQGRGELEEIVSLAAASGYDDGRIVIDPSVVRGLEYYTGPVYEVELTFPIADEHGKPVRFGSVAGGGRYDGLIARFRGEPVPATGFSIGVSRLLAALQHIGRVESRPEPGPVVVTVFPDVPLAEYQRLVAALRDAEYAPGRRIRAELYLGSGKFGAQMKYADRRGSPCVVIQGGNEKAKGEVQIKDLILGAEIAGLSKDRDDYLKKQAEAQFAVKEAELVDAVRKVLARHDVSWAQFLTAPKRPPGSTSLSAEDPDLRKLLEAWDRERAWSEFRGYAEDWMKNRPRSSRADQLASYPSYQRIIGMGPERALPCILRQLRDELRTGAPNHWFWALWALTGASPVPKEHQGNIYKMAQAWIDWGRSAGYIDAEGLGGDVPASPG